MDAKQGKTSHTHEHKKNGEVSTLKDDHKGDGLWGRQEIHGLDRAYAQAGRTISLGDFQFARFDVGIGAHYDERAVSEDDLFDELQAIVDEVCEQEEAEIRGTPREQATLEIGTKCTGIVLTISYGLTLKGEQRFESHRVDLSRSRFVNDGADINAEFVKLQEWVGDRIEAEREKIESHRGDTGL